MALFNMFNDQFRAVNPAEKELIQRCHTIGSSLDNVKP